MALILDLSDYMKPGFSGHRTIEYPDPGGCPSIHRDKTKKQLLWEANFLHKKNTKSPVPDFFSMKSPKAFNLPELFAHPLDDALDEIDLLGFPLCNVFELAKENPQDFLPARELYRFRENRFPCWGGW